MRHRECDGNFVIWTIPEHHYSFMRCDKCGRYLGGEVIARKVKRLMGTKVYPTMRRA